MQTSHTNFAKILHWGFIVLYTYGIFKQVDDISLLENTQLLIFEVIFAFIFLVIVIIRFFYMRQFAVFLGATETIPLAHKYLAKIVHWAMYFSFIMLPLSGLAIAGLYSQDIKDGPLQVLVLGLHEFSASLSYVLIFIHVGAVIYSRIKGEGVWSSMAPFLKEKGPNQNAIIKRISTVENQLYYKIEDYFKAKRE